jgi:DNA helicase II / ATP-dependent DNA helicase PcrA
MTQVSLLFGDKTVGGKDAGSQTTSSPSQFLEGLNAPQREAVEHYTSPLLVLAGAGSGKTRVLTRRIAHLISHHGVQPHKILAVTFTNKATQEMRERLEALLPQRRSAPWVSTFHALGLRILRRHADRLGFSRYFVVYDDQDSRAAVKKILKELNIDPKEFPPRSFLRMIDTLKNAGVEPVFEGEKDPLRRQVAQVYKKYVEVLEQSDAMDFNDLLHNTLKLLSTCPDVLEEYQRSLDFILVDEFQDTNKIQYQLIRLLAGSKKNLFVVGDDDQSIYAFRGATVKNLLEFERDYPETRVVKLEQNYRSTENILTAAYEVIRHNKTRKAKKLWTDGASGSKIMTYVGHNEGAEAEFIVREILQLRQEISLNDIAVFYRTNAQSRALEEAFVSRRIPYQIFGGLKFYDRREVKDLLAYLRVIVNPRDEQALLRIINTPTRGIGKKALDELSESFRGLPSGSGVVDAVAAVAESNRKVADFYDLWRLLTVAAEKLPLDELVAEIIEKVEYLRYLQKISEGDYDSKLENVKELQAIARSFEEELLGGEEEVSRFDVIQKFLERAALTSGDLPPGEDTPQEVVSMMTLHLAKGLEFDTVFFTGLEEGTLPHYRSLDDETALSEERRLCYVGVTRAKRALYLTRAQRRGMFAGPEGGSSFREVCRFLIDIPDDLLVHRSSDIKQLYSYQESDSARNFSRRAEQASPPPQRDTRSKSSSSARVVGRGAFGPVIQRADDLLSKKRASQPVVSGSVIPLAELEVGMAVVHQVFGKGTVVSIELHESQHDRSKVTVSFSGIDSEKRLVYKFARLGRVVD